MIIGRYTHKHTHRQTHRQTHRERDLTHNEVEKENK